MGELQSTATINHGIEAIVTQLQENNTALESIDKRIKYLEKTQPVNPVITTVLNNSRRHHIIKLLGGRESNAYKEKKLVSAIYRQAANDFKKAFVITRYDLLRQSDQAAAINYWEAWRPSNDLMRQIKKLNNGAS